LPVKSKKCDKRRHVETKDVICVLKLPLDEAGCLNLGTRDSLSLKAFVDQITAQGEERDYSKHLDSPYAFKPDQERMASFMQNSVEGLHKAPSNYFDTL